MEEKRIEVCLKEGCGTVLRSTNSTGYCSCHQPKANSEEMRNFLISMTKPGNKASLARVYRMMEQ